MKIKVITVKDIIKYFIKFGFVFVIIAIIANFFYGKKNTSNYFLFNSGRFLPVINKEIIILNSDKQIQYINQKNRYIGAVINSEFNMIKLVASKDTANGFFSDNLSFASYKTDSNSSVNNSENENSKDSENQENSAVQGQAQQTDSNNIENIQTGLKTEVLPSNVPDKTSVEIFGVKLRDECDYNLEEEIKDLDAKFNKNDILIFHTHTCESYTPTEQYTYQSTGNYRTTDLNYSVARVGDELEKYLVNYGYNVIHDKSYHDYPSYNGSYNRSLITVSKLLENNNNVDVVIDLHRDAIGDNTYAPKVQIGDDCCARIMFVIGTDGGGLSHDGWRNNLKFAMKVVQKGNELYPRTV